jgi:hypothetical protein
MKDYYAILGLSADDANLESMTREAITEAYRTKVRYYHPDRFHTQQQKTRMHEYMLLINEAYGVLYDPQTRANYDYQRIQSAQIAATQKAGEALKPSPLRGLLFMGTLAILLILGFFFHRVLPLRLLLLVAASAVLIYRYPMPLKPTINSVLIALLGLLTLNAVWAALPIAAKCLLFLALFYGLRLFIQRCKA